MIQTPTPPPPTASGDGEGEESDISVTQVDATRDPNSWQPPALIPPLSKHPLGYDHYWFGRPLDANANNWVLAVYPYGSDGPSQDNPLRQHHGIDMSNRVGERVRAVADGVVIWSADGRQEEVDFFQNSPCATSAVKPSPRISVWSKHAWNFSGGPKPGSIKTVRANAPSFSPSSTVE